MTAEFFSGIGAQDRTFGPDSSVPAVMAQSAGLQSVLNNYYMTGQTSGLYTFGGVGYAQAGANPVAQFVGSFRYTISPGAGGINLSLTNTTRFSSGQIGGGTNIPGCGHSVNCAILHSQALKNALLQSSCKQAQIPVTHDGGGGSIDIPKIPQYAPLDDDIPDGSDESDVPNGGGQVTIQPGFTVLGN
jgi:hypothetical protein